MTAEEMAAVHAACFTVPRPWTAGEFAGYLADPLVFILTEPGGLLVGRAVAEEAEVLTLAVLPDARRAGIGGRLLARFLAEAGRRGAGAAHLEVAAANAGAIALYIRCGFEETGRRRRYYSGADALVFFHAMGPGAPEI